MIDRSRPHGQVDLVGAPETVDTDLNERAAARLTAQGLLFAPEGESRATELAALVDAGDRHLWHDVSVVARCGVALASELEGGVPDQLIEDAKRRAETSRDPGLLALVLAFRSWSALRRARRQGRLVSGAEPDLAAAVVLLERDQGRELERVSAHATCGASFSMMGLWELAVEQFEAAGGMGRANESGWVGHSAAAELIGRAVEYNRVETETDYICALRSAGEIDAAVALSGVTTERLGGLRTGSRGWPPSWVAGLESCGLLVRAIGGEDVSAEAAAADTGPRTPPASAPLISGRADFDADATRVGQIQLARAFSLAGRRADFAMGLAEAAVVALRSASPPLRMVAMDLAASIEGAPASLRLARAQTAKLWAARRRSLESMRATISTERFKARSEELERHAHVDDLTGLANRRGFYRYLNERMVEKQPRVSLLVIDVDHFKDVNDRYGHPAGDRALQRLAGVLSRLVRPLDMAARLGGDEFFVLLDGTGAQVAIERAETIVRAAAAVGSEGGDIPLSLTIGVATGPPDDFDRLLADADRALYRGKSTGGGRWVAASPPGLSAPDGPSRG